MFERLKEWNLEHNIWKYRNERENRHQHGNNLVSFWALGFKTLNEMKENYLENGEEAKWEEYVEIHTKNKCCGFVPREERKAELTEIKRKWNKERKSKVREYKKTTKEEKLNK